MKNWFLQLPRREQYLLLIAAFGVFILLIVNGVWRPISHDVKTLKESNRALSQDVVWMQAAVAKYKELKKRVGRFRARVIFLLNLIIPWRHFS